MVELILTEKEKADPSYLDWDTDALGKLIGKMAAEFKDEYGQDAIFSTFAIRLLVDTTILANANKLTQTVENVVVDGKDFGDWEIVLRQIKKARGAA